MGGKYVIGWHMIISCCIKKLKNKEKKSFSMEGLSIETLIHSATHFLTSLIVGRFSGYGETIFLTNKN